MYRLNHDVQNIIEFMLFCNRVKNTNNEHRRIFYFFETRWDDFLNNDTCPNPSGRCVAKYIDVKIHWMDGKYHKENGPAVELRNGDKFWYVEDKLHRNPKEGPAMEYADGEKQWHVEGKLHREDGPAIEYVNGDKEWYLKGQRHRNPNEGFPK